MLTKSNFKKFLECSCQLWLIKQRPDLLPEVDAALQRIFDEGNVVDVFAKKLFPDGIEMEGFNETGAWNTKAAIESGVKVLFQPTFGKNGITCRSDILVKNRKAWDIHEVKSSTTVKEDHVFDLAFQRICIEDAGLPIGKTFLVHINNAYVKDGDIDPHQLFTSEDITKQVTDALPLARKEIARAMETLKLRPDSVLDVEKLCTSPGKCEYLVCIREALGESMPVMGGKPTLKVDKKGIADELGELTYPLYFLDYESYFPAIPMFDGYHPYGQIVFQYSVHILRTPKGKLEQKEFLHEAANDPAKTIVEALVKDIGPTGSVIVWNERFEAARNEELSRMVPKHAKALRSMNERMYDLMQIVKGGLYVDSRFDGSASLKKVLPVMAPELSYSDLVIQEGATASGSWPVLTDPATPSKQKQELKKNMLAYCERDTLAMVELYKKFLEAAK